MEDRILVKINLLLAALSLIGIISYSGIASQSGIANFFISAANADTVKDRQHIRFYKINRHEQTDRIRFTGKKGQAAGCHNFLKKTRIFKVVQFGYESCQLYSKKDCAQGAEILVTRKKDSEPVNTLTQGFGWLPESEHKRGVKLRSWNCQ